MGIFQQGLISQTTILSSDSLSKYININSLFGVVVGLAILLLIVLAYLINIKSHLVNSSSVKASKHNNSVDNAIAQIVGTEQEELVSNNELVAVITAAIHASMGDEVPAGGFVVRSIRKAR